MPRTIRRAVVSVRVPARRSLALSVTFACSSAVALAFTPVFTPALAAAPSDTGDTLSLNIDEAVRRATESSPVVQRARAERRIVESRRVEADLLLPANPMLLVGAGPTRGPGETREVGYVARLEQTVEVAGQRGTRQAEVARAVEAAMAREELARAEARARTRLAYTAARLAEAQLTYAVEREALATRIEESVRERVRLGAASDIESRLATLERGRVRRDRLEAAQAAADGLSALREAVFLPPMTPLLLTTPVGPPVGPLPSYAAAVEAAERRRAELRLLAAQGDELGASIVRLRREALPSPTVFLDLQRDRPGELLLRAGLGVPLPTWRRNQGQIALVAATRARIDDERTLAQRTIALEIDRALRAAQRRLEEVDLDGREIVPAAEAALELTTEGWRAGKFDLFRVIQVSREAGEARRHQIEALGSLWQASIELDRATGTP